MNENIHPPAPLSDEDRRALDHVLDELIPPDPDRGRPGAGQLGVAAYVDTALDTMPPVKDMIVQSLAMLNELAGRRAGRRFSELPRSDRVAVLDELAAGEHGFPPLLVLHAYAGYYQHPRVLEALGLEPRPPHPAGYPTIEGDLGLLDPVRRRPRMYRQC
jgi:hypothetical protein